MTYFVTLSCGNGLDWLTVPVLAKQASLVWHTAFKVPAT